MSRAALLFALIAWTLAANCAARTTSNGEPLETHLRAKAIADKFPPCSQTAPDAPREGSNESLVIGRLVKDRPVCREVGELEECTIDCGWEYVLRPLRSEQRYVLGGIGNLMNWAYRCELENGDVPGVFSVIGEIRTSTVSRVSVINVRRICRLPTS